MATEMDSLSANRVWTLTDLPKGRKVIGCRWVFKNKTGSTGKLIRYKARLVARGFAQIKGADYNETFSPVVRGESLRTMFAVTVQCRCQIHQLDVETAFLNGVLDEEVFMDQPEGNEIRGKEHLVCRLHKSLYGLK